MERRSSYTTKKPSYHKFLCFQSLNILSVQFGNNKLLKKSCIDFRSKSRFCEEVKAVKIAYRLIDSGKLTKNISRILFYVKRHFHFKLCSLLCRDCLITCSANTKYVNYILFKTSKVCFFGSVEVDCIKTHLR